MLPKINPITLVAGIALALAVAPAGAAEFVTAAWSKTFVDEIPAADLAKGLSVKGESVDRFAVVGGELVVRGTNNVTPPFVSVGPNARLTLRHRLGGEPLEVDVPYGAVLDCSGVTGGQAVRRITVDCLAGGGSLVNVRLVGTGTLELRSFDAVRSTGRIPLDLSAAVDGANILKWNFVIDGRREEAGGRFVYDRGAILLKDAVAAESEWSCLPMWGGGYMQNVVLTSDPKILYAYADVCGPFRSDDAGATWKLLGANLSLAARAQGMGECRSLSVDPRDPDSVVAIGGCEGRHNPGGFMVSRNGGLSWRKTACHASYGNGFLRPLGVVLARDPFNPDTLVGGEDWYGLCISLNNGDTWTRTGPTQQWYTCVHFDRVRRGRVYACARKIDKAPYYTPGHDLPRSGGFFLSEDGGRRWRKLADESPKEIVQIEGDGELVAAFDASDLRRSADGGLTWTDFSEGLDRTRQRKKGGEATLCYNALGAGKDFYLAAEDLGGIYRRGRGEAKWRRLPPPELKCENPDHEPYANVCVAGRLDDRCLEATCSLIVDPRDNDHWFATDWFEIWETHDAGRSFTTRQTGISQLCSATFECDPLSPDHLAYGVHDMALITSADGGKTFRRCLKFWLKCYGGTGHVVVNSIAYSPFEPGVMFGASYCAYGGVGIERSLDHGVTWEFPKCVGMPRRAYGVHAVNSIAFRPDRNELWACVGGKVGEGKAGPYFSTDRGETWTWAGQGMQTNVNFYKVETGAGGPVQQIAFSSDGSGVTICKDDWRVYAWIDRERRWQATTLPSGARTWKLHTLAADPHVPGRFMLGGERFICESTDGGLTWHRFAGYDGECLHFGFDRHVPGLLVLACADAIRVSWDGGRTFEVLPGGYRFDTCGITARASHYSCFVPVQVTVDRQRLFFATQSAGVFRRDLRRPASTENRKEK